MYPPRDVLVESEKREISMGELRGYTPDTRRNPPVWEI